MRIEAELDAIHGERLRVLQIRLERPLEEVLGVAIDAALLQLENTQDAGESPLYAALDEIGFIGCIESDANLSASYKEDVDFSDKTGDGQ